MVLYLNEKEVFADYNKDLEEAYFSGVVPANNKRIAFAVANKIKPSENDNSKIVVAVTREQLFNNMDYIIKNVSSLSKIHKNVFLVVDGMSGELAVDQSKPSKIEYCFNKKEIAMLKKMNSKLNLMKNNVEIVFNEFFSIRSEEDTKACWPLNDIIELNEILQDVANDVKSNNLSPYEALLFVYNYITNEFSYGENYNGNDHKIEQNISIMGAVFHKKTICNGFAALLTAIIEKIGDPNLKCQFKSAMYLDHGKIDESHALCLIEINDNKYGIQGKYFSDPSNDSNVEKDRGDLGFALSLFPIADMDHEKKGRTVRYAKYASRYSTINVDWENEGNCSEDDHENYWKSTPNRGEPIPVDKLEQALSVMFEAWGISEKLLRDAFVSEEIKKSFENAGKIFKPSASNHFAHNDIENE